MTKYGILLNILDQLRNEAPTENRRYYPAENDNEGLNQARSRAFIHLYLKVKFGLLDFKARERLVTDGSNDGGIDAYYINEEIKKVYFIQSKFRTTENNFNAKEILLRELLNMEVDRILEGEGKDELGEDYNGKIKQLIREIGQINDIGRYKYEVVILANLNDKTPSQLRRLTGGFHAVVFDYERTYKELVFPVVKGTYYNPSELRITINLTNTSSGTKIDYGVKTAHNDCDITVLFVPTAEIAKTLYKYKNSILKHNPRSYLELANNIVNKDIAKTITSLQTNEFALYNNGITMLSYDTAFNEKIGKKEKAQLIVTQPQIINGGQTAYTLSRIYEDNLDTTDPESIFTSKEVLLKVITLRKTDEEDDAGQLELIETISKATNQQTPVDDADRRSNDRIQIQIQNAIYNEYGYFYERKRGEYADGLRSGYIHKAQIIDRDILIRLCNSCDFKPAEAKRFKHLFKEENFVKTLNDVSRYHEYFFSFKCYEHLNNMYGELKKTKSDLAQYGNALQHGMYAVVSACMLKYEDDKSLEKLENIINTVLGKWKRFESLMSRRIHNKLYLRSYVDKGTGKISQFFNFADYYKGQTLNADLLKYFKRS